MGAHPVAAAQAARAPLPERVPDIDTLVRWGLLLGGGEGSRVGAAAEGKQRRRLRT